MEVTPLTAHCQVGSFPHPDSVSGADLPPVWVAVGWLTFGWLFLGTVLRLGGRKLPPRRLLDAVFGSGLAYRLFFRLMDTLSPIRMVAVT